MRKLLRLKAMLLLCVLIAGSGNVWADDTESVTFSNEYSDKDKPTSYEGTDFTITFDKGTSSNAPQYYASGTGVRIYCGGTMAFSSTSKKIKSIAFTCKVNASSSTVPSSVSASTGTVDFGTISTSTTSGSWSAADDNTSSVTFTVNGTKGNIQIQSATVTFVASDPTAPSATLSKSSLNFGEVIFGQTKSMTFTVTPANLTGNLTISCNNDKYEVSPSTIAQETTTSTTITITAKPTAIDDDMDGTVTISGGGLASSKTVTLSTTVTAKEAVDPVGPAGSAGKFVKVTSTSDITDGDYLIVYETDGVAFNGELETLDAAYNVISVTISNGEIAETSDNLKAVFTIDTTNGTLKSASGYYIGVSTNSNGLKQTDDADTYQHTFGIDSNGNASIASSFTGSNRILLFNSSTSSGNYRFRYYGSTSSTNKAIQLYKYVPGTSGESFDVTIGSAGYKTLVSSVDFATKTGTTAYIVTASSASSATLTSVSEVPAGTPVILKGSGTVTLDVIDNAATVNGNLLQVSTESTGNGVYVLANKNDVVGFYLWKGGSLGAGRVYLPAPAGAGAREFIGFGDESTGIKDYSRETTTNNRCYNLNGQRVDAHQKGLYIVNGKKVIIK